MKISFLDNTDVQVKPGTNLISAIISTGRPIGNSCSAIGICGKCFVQVKSGMENLSPLSTTEINLLKRENLASDYRMACLVKVMGPVTITTSYW